MTVGWTAAAFMHACRKDTILRDGYGYAELTATETNKFRMIGLSFGDNDQQYSDIDYAIYLHEIGSVYVFEGGTYRGNFGAYASGDRLRVEVLHGVVRYLKNGAVMYTSATPPRYPLRVDTSLNQTGATVTDVRVGSTVWANEVGVSVRGSSLTKTGAAGWTSGSSSANALEAADGYMDFVATETNTTRVAGLGTADVNQTWQDVEFGIQIRDDAVVEVVEGGTSRGTFGSYGAGDRFRVEARAGVVRYYRNGGLLYTSGAAPSYPLRVDSALYSAGATLTDVVLEPLIWTNESGVAISGNSLKKTAADGWNAGASGTRPLESGDGFAEWTSIETNTRRAVGLKVGTGSAQSYSDIDFAIDLGAAGTVEVFELGTSRGQFGSYAHGDRLRVEINQGVVRYLKNGTVLHTSSVPPTYPLHAEATLYTAGATVADLHMGDLVWTNAVGVQASALAIRKTGSGVDWNAGLASSRAINTGHVEFTASEANTYRMIGLDHSDASQSYTDIDYAIYCHALGSLHIYEAGTYRGQYGTYQPGDRIRVAVESGVVKYYKSGTLLYTSTVSPVLPLNVDTSFYDPGSTLLGVTLVGSAVVSTLDPPTFSPQGGTYATDPAVTLTAMAGSTVRYTTDGSQPTVSSPVYASPIAVGQSLVIKAAAWKAGWNPSAVASATYTLSIATPTIAPSPGSYVGALPVSMSSVTSGVTWRYRLDGAEPTESDASATGSTITVDRSGTLRVKGFRAGWTPSATVGGVYWIALGTAAAPSMSPPAGTFTSAQSVTLTSATAGAVIRYAVDGTDPTFKSAVYTGPIAVARTTELRARAFKGDMTPSGITTGVYVINAGTADAPRLSPGGGTYATGQVVTATSGTAAVTIRYTTNGLDPVETDPGLSSGGTVTISRSTRLKVRAYAAGSSPSAVVTADYETVGAIAAGSYHSLALKAEGTAWSWGSNGYGQLGDGTTTSRLSPVPVIGLTDVIAISSGYTHSVALKRDGTVFAWGRNTHGQLGDGTQESRTSPVQVSGLAGIVGVAAGAGHTLALKADGSVWSWGDNASGQLGDGAGAPGIRLLPAQVLNLTGITQIAANHNSSLALKTDGAGPGTVWGWGDNTYGQLGNGATFWFVSTPVQVAGLTNAVSVAEGSGYSLAIRADSTLATWGLDDRGQLGDGTGVTQLSPVPVALPQAVRAVAGGVSHPLSGGHTVAALSDGSAWAWGYNGSGQIGDSSFSNNRLSPVRVGVVDRTISVAGGEAHSLALREDGRIWAWGHNGAGQIGDGTATGDIGTLTRRPILVPNFSAADQSWLDGDVDGDGLSTRQELARGTDPLNPDTNGDGIRDGAAIASGRSATNLDMDGDGVTNALEIQRGTDPFLADTDGDGVGDATDAFPLDPTRWQAPPPTPGDTTPPVINLTEPTNATLVSSNP